MSEIKNPQTDAPPAEEKKVQDNGVNAKLRVVESRLDKVVGVLEKMFGFDIDGDKKIGLFLVGLGLAAVTAFGVAQSTSTIWNLTDSTGTNDLAQVDTSGNLNIDGNITADNVNPSGTTSVNILNATGAVTAASTLSVRGNTTLDNTSITGTLAVAETLGVQGVTTLDNTSITGTLSVAETLTVHGLSTVNSITSTGTATAAALVVQDSMTASGRVINLSGVGAATTSTASVVESYGFLNKSTFTFNKTLTATDGSEEGETAVIYTFPEGRIYILGGAIDATIVNTATEADTNDSFIIGIGTAAANDDADLSDSNETDIFAGPTLEDAAVTLTNAWEGDITAGADSVFDGTSTAATLNLNMGIADACIPTGNFSATVTGTASVYWINLGDD